MCELTSALLVAVTCLHFCVQGFHSVDLLTLVSHFFLL
jgi:hypothetical protein